MNFKQWLINLDLEAILASDSMGAIGLNNHLAWRLSKDLEYFKTITSNQVIIMGHNTFKSLPFYPKSLPGRTSIVINSNISSSNQEEGVYYVTSNKQALDLMFQLKINKAIVIGGAQIYKKWIPSVDTIHYTAVETTIENADAFVDLASFMSWPSISLIHHLADEKNQFNFIISRYHNQDKDSIIKQRYKLSEK